MYGLRRTTASATSLLNNFEIAATALLAFTLSREKVSRRLWTAIGLITAASMLLSAGDSSGKPEFSTRAIFVLLAAFCRGLENNYTRRITAFNPYEIVTIEGICCGLGSSAVGMLQASSCRLSLIASARRKGWALRRPMPITQRLHGHIPVLCAASGASYSLVAALALMMAGSAIAAADTILL